MKRTITAVPVSTVKSTTAKSSRSSSPGIPNTHLFLLPFPALPLPCLFHRPAVSNALCLVCALTIGQFIRPSVPCYHHCTMNSAQSVQAACGSAAAWS